MMKQLGYLILIFVCGSKAYALESFSTVNMFSPGTSQVDFSSIETVKVLDKRKFSALFFLDSSYQSLAVYRTGSGDPEAGNDVLSFAHIGLSYGLFENIEVGIKGPAIFNQSSDGSQSSLILTSKGFTNIDGFAKYKLLDKVTSGLSLLGQLGVANGDEIFYVGPGSGLNYSLSVLYQRVLGSWMFASSLGYIKRTPGEQGPALPIFEPINGSVTGTMGLSRPITQGTKASLELLLASHDFESSQSERSSLSSEALLSFHTKYKALNISYGASAGLTNGVSTPTARGFLGFQYQFGSSPSYAKNDEPAEREPAQFEKEAEQFPISEDMDIVELDAEEETATEVFEEPVQVAEKKPEVTQEEIDDIILEQSKEPEVKKPQAVIAKPVKSQKIILNNIEFGFNSAELNHSSKKLLAELAVYLKQNRYGRIQIWGHTDFYGPSIYNEYLGLKRSKAVYDFLKTQQVNARNMSYDAFGERRPVSVGISDAERKVNRRVEIMVIKKSGVSDEN